MKDAQVPAKRGRKKIDLSDKETLEKIKHFAGLGLSDKAIADSLGVSPRTITRRKKDSVIFGDTLRQGKVKAVADVSNALFDSATSGNVSAQIFFLKNRGSGDDVGAWKDRTETNTNYSVNLAEIINDRKNLIEQVPTRYKTINQASNPDNTRVEGLVINQKAEKKTRE